ncbi:hypothetical protein [Bacillus cereus]|uniref:hypothetical protein n=1 Tax=Bacillus cereus TaxID=1396 RepID=UPI0014824A4B|nr:hypothetical protein [Bacillus cereus]
MGFGGSCGESYGFAVDTKVSMDDSLQYKVHNSKGKVYYVIANNELGYFLCFSFLIFL